MQREELLKVVGGASISGTLINALVRGVNALMEVGRSLGSAIRMYSEGTKCSI